MTIESDLPGELFERLDTSPDALFYGVPRLVNHIDAATISNLTAYYQEILFAGADVLDLMSSWVSHLPATPRLGRVVGLGMNAEELRANPRLNGSVVHDLNVEPRLPFAAHTFDFALIAVSVQYLTQPVIVMRDIARILKPGGRLVVAMSHRCFPTKAIRAFHGIDADQRVALVSEFLRRADAYDAVASIDRSPPNADPLWLVSAATRAVC